jgi:ATP-dependent helicase/nuclease subunit A
MTRARDLLILSGGATTKPGHDTVLSLLGEVMADEPESSTAGQICIGTSRLMRVITPARVAMRGRGTVPLSKVVPAPALGSILMRRQVRQVEWEQRRTTPRRVTPSSLSESITETISQRTVTGRDAELARMVGVCAHAVLERWDFSKPRSEISTVIERACRRHVAPDYPQLMCNVTEDLTAIFEKFLSSEPYTRLQRATVLGREVPFVMPFGEDRMMEGVIDVIYRLDDRIWIADYKTDDVAAEDVQARADRYRSQADSYSQAVAGALGLSSVSFQLIFLRPGVAVDV